MSRDREDVVRWAREQASRRTRGWRGYCLKFSRMAAGAPGLGGSAMDAWRRAKRRHTTGTPPRGTFVFWSGGKHGHVVVSSGDGDCYGTDLVVRDQVRWHRISEVSRRWGYKYLGWTEDINGVTPDR